MGGVDIRTELQTSLSRVLGKMCCPLVATLLLNVNESSPPSGDALSASNHEPTLFFSLLAPSLPHLVRGAKGTGDSGCEVHDCRGEETIGVEELSRVPFLQTMHLGANDIAVAVALRLSSLLSCKKKSTLRPYRQCIK